MTTSDANNYAPHPSLYRIGAVAKLSGVPVSTLRIWELRHQAFAPSKTTGQHRLYSQQDVQRASLLKQLSDAGHAISSIASLATSALVKLQHQARVSANLQSGQKPAASTVSMVVVGPGLALRSESRQFKQGFQSNTARVTAAFSDLAEACAAPLDDKPQILLVKVNTLQDGARAEIQKLASALQVLQTVVLYSFATQAMVQAMRLDGLIVRREPISDQELSDLISSVLLVDTARALGELQPTALIPPRKYSDETLSRIAGMSTQVQCECPRHVAELLAQLANFEQYSQECLSKSPQDAHLHAYLHAVSGTARALFERALEMVAEHENIVLTEVQALGA